MHPPERTPQPAQHLISSQHFHVHPNPFPRQARETPTFEVAALDQAYLDPGGQFQADILHNPRKVGRQTGGRYSRLTQRPMQPSQA